MFIPSQGFRHAATLLIRNSARAIPVDASPEATGTALDRLAHELVALAGDTRVSAEAAEWLIAEFNSTVDRLSQSFDRDSAKSSGEVILARAGSHTPAVEPHDLFVIYVPDDRLPVAAPLAVELAKRRVTVALAEYEVASEDQLAAALQHGLAHHRGGVVLVTDAFLRAKWDAPSETARLRLVRTTGLAAVEGLATWGKSLRVSKD
jgi:hypothetical protein